MPGLATGLPVYYPRYSVQPEVSGSGPALGAELGSALVLASVSGSVLALASESVSALASESVLASTAV